MTIRDLSVFGLVPTSSDVDLRYATGSDLATVSGLEQLQQSLRLWVLAPLGSSAGLGWPRHGSRLAALIGQPDAPLNRTAAAAALREALLAHPDVADVGAVSVTSDRLKGLLRLAAAVTVHDGVRVALRVDLPMGG